MAFLERNTGHLSDGRADPVASEHRYPGARGRGGRAAALAALFLSALALRPQLVGIGPLFPEIQDDLASSHAVIGLLGTIPVLCMGLFAPPAPLLARRLGSRYGIALCLGLIGVFGIARALAPGAPAVVLLTFPLGVGMGFAGALLPVAVKELFPDRPAFATGIYASGINLGSAISSAVTVPVAGATFGWRGSLLAFSGATVGLLAAWLFLTRHAVRHTRVRSARLRLPFGSPIAWVFVLLFALMGTVFYGLNSWLPDLYVERGWSEGRAGALLAVLNAAALPTTVIVPWLADRAGSRRLYLASAAGGSAIGLLGLALVPGVAFVWVALTGLCFGVLFPLILTLPLDVSSRPEGVGAVAGLMLGGGYVVASVSPFLLGAVRDATGGYSATLWVIVGAGVALFLASLPLSRERLRAAA